MATLRPSLDTVARRLNGEGQDAYRLGVPLRDNPYFGTRNALYWAEGWHYEEAVRAQELNGDQDDETCS